MMPRVATATGDTRGGSGKGNSHTVTIFVNQGPESGLLTSTRETRVEDNAMPVFQDQCLPYFMKMGLRRREEKEYFQNPADMKR